MYKKMIKTTTDRNSLKGITRIKAIYIDSQGKRRSKLTEWNHSLSGFDNHAVNAVKMAESLGFELEHDHADAGDGYVFLFSKKVG